jgi:Domain of unknown function (DUF1772)
MHGLLLPAVTYQSQAKPSPSKENARAATPTSQLVRQWRLVYLNRKEVVSWFALESSISFAYVAWDLPATSSSPVNAEDNLRNLRWTFVLAASLTTSAFSWTFVIMKSTNTTLYHRAAQADARAEKGAGDDSEQAIKGNEKKGESNTTGEVMRWWGFLVLVRSSLALSAIFAVALDLFLYG